MKTNFIFSILVLGLTLMNSSEAFQEKFLIRAMGQKNFSSSLMTSAMEVARDLKDQTGCLHKTALKPNTDKFVICDFNEILNSNSRCHLINTKKNTVEATGPVAFGSKGVTAQSNSDTTKKTLLGAFVTTNEMNKKSRTYTRKLVRSDGSAVPANLNPEFKPNSSRMPASTKGQPVIVGSFAEVLKKESDNLIWVNHSVKHNYDNACGQMASRKTYESDMNDVQLAEYRAKNRKSNRELANQKQKEKSKRGLASEKK